MFPRLVLGYLLALPVVVPLVANSLGKEPWEVLLTRQIGAWWSLGIILVFVCEKILLLVGPPVQRAVHATSLFARANPRGMVVMTALISVVLANYPILFFGRSFGTPNNGHIPMLYAQPPYVPGSTDVDVEPSRGTDVGAMMVQSVPHSRVQREALVMGEIPLWNRYNGGGRSLWGQGLSYILDPLHWLTLLPPDPSIGWDLKFLAHRFVFATGIGFTALAATGGWLPSSLAAAASLFGGIFAYRLNHPAIFSLTYAPWILLGWFHLARATQRVEYVKALALVAVASSLVLFASPPKEAVVTLLAMQASGGGIAFCSAGSWRQRGYRLAAGCMAGAICVLTTMPHWLVFLDTLRSSFTAYDTPSVTLAGIPNAIALSVSPLVPGIPFPGLHLLALVMTIAALTEPRRLLKYQVWSCAIVAVCLIAVAFGALPKAWLLRMPFFGQIDHIDHTLPTAALTLLLIVCAAGVDVLLNAGLLRVSMITLSVGIMAWWLLGHISETAGFESFELWVLLLIFPVAISVPGCWLAARRGFPQPVPLITAALGVGILLLPGGLHVNSGVRSLNKLLIQPRHRAALNGRSAAVETVHHWSTEPVRTVGVGEILFPGTQALYELEGVGGADPLEVPAYRELVDAAGVARSWVWATWVMGDDLTRLGPLLDLLNVKYVLGGSNFESPGLVNVPVRGSDRITVGRRDSAWPRAFFVDGVISYEDAPDLLNKVRHVGGPFAAIQTGDRRAAELTRGMKMPSGEGRAAREYTLTSNTTSFAVRAPGPGIAVLTETFLPEDFRATLNGTPVPYFRVNHAFKGVLIPSSGDWAVKFEYRPAHWGLSLTMAALGMALLVAAGVWAWTSHNAVGTVFSENPAPRASS